MAKKDWYLEHLIRLHNYESRVWRIYQKYIDEFSRLAAALKIDPGKPFSFADFPATKASVEKALAKIATEVQIAIETGSREEWIEAAKVNDDLVKKILPTTKLSEDQLSGFMRRNLDALGAFQKRKEGGLGLSDRVWRITEQFSEEMELAIDTAIGDGRPAAQLSRDIRGLLKEPDKLFRRVRNKRGQLVLSKRAKAYHPGRGVYRSSYKNAMRLARTEINMSYRTSDQTRWKQLPFVVGYEIKMSANHPCRDMCDQLTGRYPKDFIFKGWHPHCRCYAIPILCSDEERAKLRRQILNGEPVEDWKSKDEVLDVPKSFDQYIKANKTKLAGYANTPYYIRDNFVGGQISGGLKLRQEKPVVAPVPKPIPDPVAADPIKPKKEPLPPSKTVQEAEERFRKAFPGVTIDFTAFKKKDLPIVDNIYESFIYHVDNYPRIMDNIQYIGSLKDHYEALVEALTDENLPSYPWKDRDSVRKMVTGIRSVKSRSPRSNANTYAFSDPAFKDKGLNGIVWNNKYGVDESNKALQRDVRLKWHPVCCDKPRSIIDHEIGHKIDELLGLRSDPDFLRVFNEETAKGYDYILNNLSGYAWKGRDPKAEFIAEAWSEYLNNPDPRPIALKIGHMIEAKYKKKFP